MKQFIKHAFVLVVLLFSVLNLSCDSNIETQPDDLDEIIGQMLIVGFRGFEITPGSPIYRDLTQYKIGGVVLYDRDVTLGTGERNIKSPEQLSNLVKQIKNFAYRFPIIAIDQEGGRVNRLKTAYGFPPTVSAQYLGNLSILDSTYIYTERMAKTINSLGINLNFAPVVDLNVNPTNPVIGAIERSFSADPAIVVEQSLVYMNAHKVNRVLNCLKHFPGHGSSKTDSHLGFTDVTDTWTSLELQPYKELIKKGEVDMIMTAHIFNGKLDSVYPATLSSNIMTNLLRKEMGYDGVIISDDMQMKAITEHYGLEIAVERCLQAGVDIIMFSNNSAHDPDITLKVNSIIKKFIYEGKITRERLLESYNRIKKLKSKLERN